VIGLPPIVISLAGVASFWTKVLVLLWLQMTVRWTLPRFRYDQIMRMGWKMILPLSLLNIFVTGAVILAFK
jgi:NADH-quinone oxidoreductase subunit H